MSTEIKALMSQANESALEFSKLYYDTFDKRRQALSKLYKDEARLIWNGNASSGTTEIMKFFDGLPSSIFTLESLDTHPIVGGPVDAENSNSIMVTTFGKIKFKDTDAEAFTQTFILSATDNKWKIVCDTFRFMTK